MEEKKNKFEFKPWPMVAGGIFAGGLGQIMAGTLIFKNPIATITGVVLVIIGLLLGFIIKRISKKKK